MICHGQGNDPTPRADPFDDGCCFVDGAPCPVRWYIDYSTSSPAGDIGTATMYDSDRNLLGTVFAYVDGLMPGGGPNKAARVQRVLDQVQGTVYVCSAAAYVIGMDPSLINDPAAFEAAWEAHVDYQPIADIWEARGKPRNYCMIYGPPEGQCCFSEDQATNDARASALTEVAVQVRSGRAGAG